MDKFVSGFAAGMAAAIVVTTGWLALAQTSPEISARETLKRMPQAFTVSGGIDASGITHILKTDDVGRVICSPEH